IDGVSIAPGDLVVGDADGVVIVPRAAEAEILDRAWTKVSGENRTREALRTGTLLAEVYRQYGVL
ncbi:MAG TPA: RraA family protein, partial [Isosphaeraceae bacterium]|nr:RraA family protein [Isosphaeraceae bacterium]